MNKEVATTDLTP